MKLPALIFIVGPTASGKTNYALSEAERLGAVILSCDSLCVYRGMDIGTAKPSPEEQARIPHFGIDLTEPERPYSVAQYIAYRDSILEQQRQKGQPVLVVGGSGFYLKSFFSPVIDQVELPREIEVETARLLEVEGLEGLLKALRVCNPSGATFPGLDTRNPRRVEKALIRCRATGRTYAELREAYEALPEPLTDWNKEVRLISRSPEDLLKRNRLRVKTMLKAGLLEEVRHLRDRGFEKNPSAAGAIGYREVLEFQDKPTKVEVLEEAIVTHTNQLVRKQRTWFKHQIPVHRKLAWSGITREDDREGC